MKEIFIRALRYLTNLLKDEESEVSLQEQEAEKDDQEAQVESSGEPQIEMQVSPPAPAKVKGSKKNLVDKSRNKILREPTEFAKDPRDIRDVMELMEVPFVALSKKRTAPIIYESPNSKSKVMISGHPPHYVASIYGGVCDKLP